MQNELDLISIGEAANYLNVSIDTLRRWEKKGKIEPLRSPGGHRYYTRYDLDNLFGKKYERAPETKPRKRKENLVDKAHENPIPEKITQEEIGSTTHQSILETIAITLAEPSPMIPQRQAREIEIPISAPLKIIKDEVSSKPFNENLLPKKEIDIKSPNSSILNPPSLNSSDSTANMKIQPENLKETSQGIIQIKGLTRKQKGLIFTLAVVLITVSFIIFVIRQSNQRILSPIP